MRFLIQVGTPFRGVRLLIAHGVFQRSSNELPGGEGEIPNPNRQIPGDLQGFNLQSRIGEVLFLSLDDWSLFGVWNLGLGPSLAMEYPENASIHQEDPYPLSFRG